MKCSHRDGGWFFLCTLRKLKIPFQRQARKKSIILTKLLFLDSLLSKELLSKIGNALENMLHRPPKKSFPMENSVKKVLRNLEKKPNIAIQ